MGFRCSKQRASRALVAKFGDKELVPSGVCLSSLLALLALVPAPGDCEQFDYFRLTDVEGEMTLGYSVKETKQDRAGELSSYEKRPAWEEEISISTNSYVFHPNLLQMELSGAVRFEQEKLQGIDLETTSKETVYDFSGRWSFLRYKPYPVDLYYTKSHPFTAVSFADVMSVETETYGASFYLRQPLISTPMELHARHTMSEGSSSTSIVDDSTDSLRYSILFEIGDYGTSNLGLSTVTSKSASGSTDLPVQESRTDEDSLDFSSRLAFGADENFIVSNNLQVTQEKQTIALDRDYANFYNYINWKLDDSLQFFNTYSYTATKYEMEKTDNQSVVIGSIKQLNDYWRVASNIDANRETSDSFKRSAKGVSGSVNYQRALSSRWNTSINYGAKIRDTNQRSDQNAASVQDEAHVLSGLSAVSLSHEYVMTGSVSVSNQTHTQTYVENIDYRLTLVGSETTIERLLSGNIADGETVLVSYDYETGGSYDYREIDQSLSMLYSLDRRYDFSLFYSQYRPQVLSGIPARGLVKRERYQFGVEAQVPISRTVEYNWNVEYERRIDELSPFRRAQMDLRLDAQLPFMSGRGSVGASYQAVENEYSLIDVKEARYRATLSIRPSWRSIARLDLSFRKDNGAEELKEFADAVLGYTWVRGRLLFDLTGKYTKERQGETTRTRKSAKATLTRKFR